ncbi:MAG: hypothetical protein GC152_16320 [Alphaproteobacteria bacterium]|nr:hypothetical protein [Alphaproteobacteria bacterium]
MDDGDGSAHARRFKAHRRLIRGAAKYDKRLLQSLRFQEQSVSTRAGALLAFSGLLIATTIVQLAGGEDSLVAIHARAQFLLATAGLGLLFAAAFLSLASLVLSNGDYGEDAPAALARFHDLIRRKQALSAVALWLVAIGAAFVCISLALSIAASAGLR